MTRKYGTTYFQAFLRYNGHIQIDGDEEPSFISVYSSAIITKIIAKALSLALAYV